MAKGLKIWCLMGSSDEGTDEPALYSTYEKAKNAFDELVDDINALYEETVCEVEDGYASYDRGSHYGSFWICEIEVQ